jgi:predicted flap endonuclease-1-like 5' DNA nuclease
MVWLAGEIWVLLVVAFAAGAGVSAWAFSARRGEQESRDGEALDTGMPVRAAEPAILLDLPDGQKDDLTQIIGIDQPTEIKLNALGVFHLRQIAAWDESAARWIEIRLNEPGRVVRERWAEQAASIS